MSKIFVMLAIMLNYNHLYYFYEVAKFGSISQAAKHLNLSQPSLSIQIKTLEEQIGVKLLEKKGRNIVLTEKGEKLFAQCSRMFPSTQEILTRIDDKEKVRSIKIAINQEVESSLIAEVAQKVNKKMNTPYRIKLHRVPDTLFKEKENQLEIDIFISNRKFANNKILTLYKNLNVPINLFQSRVHKVSEKKLILPGENHILRDETDSYLQQNDIHDYQTVLETDFTSSMIRSVIDGYGVCYMPVSYMLEPMQEGLVIKSGPKKGYWVHPIYIYWQQQDFLVEWVNRFYQILANTMKV